MSAFASPRMGFLVVRVEGGQTAGWIFPYINPRRTAPGEGPRFRAVRHPGGAVSCEPGGLPGVWRRRSPTSESMAANPQKPFHILLVEDEPVIRELVRSMLSDGSVEVVCAANGLEGLKLAKSRPFQLVLMDVVLPQLDGISVCRMLKSDPSTSQVPIYMLTAKSKKSDMESATLAGANGYIQKPFKGAELMALVERLRA
jgi:CheY-like chemotaxis protein